jgi:hypothetical protein
MKTSLNLSTIKDIKQTKEQKANELIKEANELYTVVELVDIIEFLHQNNLNAMTIIENNNISDDDKISYVRDHLQDAIEELSVGEYSNCSTCEEKMESFLNSDEEFESDYEDVIEEYNDDVENKEQEIKDAIYKTFPGLEESIVDDLEPELLEEEVEKAKSLNEEIN